MNENKRGYWIYSIVTIIVFVGLFAFWGWLIYDLIIKLSDKDFSNNTVVQALITLVVTVFIGGYFNKWLEIRNSKKLGKDDILQVAHYLKEKGVGFFGLIFSRCGGDPSAEIHLRDIWQSENKMIVILSDNDVEQMLLGKQRGNDPSRIIIEKIQEFRQKI